jgi:hypothetical protein
LDEARDAIRNLRMNKQLKKSNITIYLRDGEYHHNKTFELKIADYENSIFLDDIETW